jgi:hypothetical protein
MLSRALKHFLPEAFDEERVLSQEQGLELLLDDDWVLASGPPADPASPMPMRPLSASTSTSSALRAVCAPAALMYGLSQR